MQYNDFSNKLKQSIELSTKNKIKKKKSIPHQPWATKEFICLNHSKNVLFAKTTKLGAHKNTIDDYKLISSQVSKLKKALRSQYYSKLLNTDIRNSWKGINTILAKEEKKQKLETKQLRFEETIVTDQQEICEIMSNYYSEIAKKLSQQATTRH